MKLRVFAGSEWLGEAFAPATSAGNAHCATRFRRSETKLERGRGCNSLRSQQQSALERVSPVVETGVNTLSVDAGAPGRRRSPENAAPARRNGNQFCR